jgi:phosphatidylserine/phosphatidylglycerophosphate/cardiolipin synthase-like enzyme
LRVARASRACVLIDGDAYFKAFARAALRATRSVVIVGWDFHSRMRLHHGLDGVPDLLGEFLNFLVKRRRSLDVHVLTWDYSVLFAKGREPSPAYGLGWRPHRRVHFRYDSKCPLGSAFHQKLTVIDGAVGFCGGLDLTRGRWDTPLHAPEDPRRTNVDESDPYAPFHDAMWAVDGQVARTLYEVANDRWMRATGAPLPRIDISGDPWPDLPVQFREVDLAIARTLPQYEDRKPVTEVQALYLDMIGAARRYIYLENQYFTSSILGDALEKRLQEPDGPEVIAVLRLRNHGWLEAPTMATLRTVLLQRLRAADRYGRFHACYPYIPGLSPEKCCDLHTKLMIVDDEWLRVGSANFANRSMGLDTECDLVLEARGDARTRNSIAGVRDRLLAEHLDLPVQVIESHIRRTGSVGAAVQAFAAGSGRTLRYFERLDEPSDALVAVANNIADRHKPVSWEEVIAGFVPDTDAAPIHRGRVAVQQLATRLQQGKSTHRWLILAGLTALAVIAAAAARRRTKSHASISADRYSGGLGSSCDGRLPRSR